MPDSKMKHLHHKPGSFKKAPEREHDKVMGPRRHGDASEDLGGFLEPGGRMGAQEQEQKRGLPLDAESTREEALSEAVGGQRSRSPLFSGWGGQDREDDFLACSAEQKVYPRG